MKKIYWAGLLLTLTGSSFSLEKALAQKTVGSLPEPPIATLDEAGDRVRYWVIRFIYFFWILAIAMVIWAAYLFLTAGDNEDKITEAKKRLKFAVIAAAIALVATGIRLLVYGILAGNPL